MGRIENNKDYQAFFHLYTMVAKSSIISTGLSALHIKTSSKQCAFNIDPIQSQCGQALQWASFNIKFVHSFVLF